MSMDAVKYIKEKNRMCRSLPMSCDGCEIGKLEDYICEQIEFEQPEKCVEIVEQWSNEHLKKTRQSELKQHYPYVLLDIDGIVRACPKDIDQRYHCPETPYCDQCRKEYWLKEIE